ncbi:hypothetical protein L2E82_14243 [Cichorium intybus]|uniref:Uncharacterized protein n=1 Tax=Cichorium intybus TaxID=13427 RepID=A0ACB9F090_CICIN|nr:hypothetical protein L2E82_14243 [Cichorium intybus]
MVDSEFAFEPPSDEFMKKQEPSFSLQSVEISEYANNHETLLLEAIHYGGYSGALANPFLASEGSLNRLNSSILEEFVAHAQEREKNDNKISTAPRKSSSEELKRSSISFFDVDKHETATSRWARARTTAAKDSWRFGGVGEVSIDFASYVDATNIYSLYVPLKNANFAAILHEVKRFENEFQKLIELPLSLFTCKTLTKLKMVASSDDLDVFNVSYPVMLPVLKTLDLRVSGIYVVNVLKFIYGCPVLESLSLEIIWPCNEEDCSNINIPTLKRLELRTMSCLSNNTTVLNLPNLEYLIVGGKSCPHFVMEDVSSLVQANDFVVSPMPKFPNLKHLELKGSFQSLSILVIQILENTCKLEHLSIEEPQESGWIEPQSVPTCMITNLRTMIITKCKGRKCDLQFLEYLLGNAEVLKTLTIICGSLRMKQEMEMCARLLKFPRASRFCEIHFVGKWLNSIGK